MNTKATASLLSFLFLLLFSRTVLAENVTIFKQVPSSLISAKASSELKGSPASNVVDGIGMLGEKHVANNLGEGMWVTNAVSKQVRLNSHTHEGVAWFLCTISGNPIVIDQIRLWNHNQNEHTRRGINKIFIEYSTDGKSWELLKAGKSDYHIIPESVGRNPESVDWILNTKGIKAKYLCFTVAGNGEGNHYDRYSAVVMREAADMNQNPDYYGMSEIRFYQRAQEKIENLPEIDNLTLKASQGYLKTVNGPTREFVITFSQRLFTEAKLNFQIGKKSWTEIINSNPDGLEEYRGTFPSGYMNDNQSIEVVFSSKQGSFVKAEEVLAARKWNVYFLPHSHIDIGYTHKQEDVMKLQWRNLERALELSERTKNYPVGSQFKWNSEVTWAISDYLKKYLGTEKGELIIEAIKEGRINVDAPIGSILTGISGQEELMHIFDDAHWISSMTGVKSQTAMQSDVPGQVWGMATALSQNGIKYFSPGPNYVPFYGKIGNDRAGALHPEWGDRPFYWKSQSGNDSVLTTVSIFHVARVAEVTHTL